ncbi:MAG: Rieske 2Fe-2S domain-containing protein, partial [Candidatus Nanopelagicales bacterium]
IDVEGVVDDPQPSPGTLIPIDALTARLRPANEREPDLVGAIADFAWEPIPHAPAVPTGGLSHAVVAGSDVLLCRIGDHIYAYRDRCPRCAAKLSDGVIERRLGGARNSAVLTCAGCRSHFDVQQAGIGLDATDLHLDPLPLLERDGVWQIAIPFSVSA